MKTLGLTSISGNGLDIQDFASRWRKSRVSAIVRNLDVTDDAISAMQDEVLLLGLVPDSKKDNVLKDVFDHSRKLGKGAVKFHQKRWVLKDLVLVLSHASEPCLQGKWTQKNSAQVLERQGCEPVKKLGSFYCHYWREALDGLVMGVGEDERYARHASIGVGDSLCTDVLFLETPDARQNLIRFGKIPDEVGVELLQVQKKFKELKVKVDFLGISEATLFYKMEADVGPLCGAGGRIMHDSFKNDVLKLFPDLKTQDVSPVAVYGSGT